MKKYNGDGHESFTDERSAIEAGTRVKEKANYQRLDQYGLIMIYEFFVCIWTDGHKRERSQAWCAT